MSSEASHSSGLDKWQYKSLKSNQIFSCVKTGYRLKRSLQKTAWGGSAIVLSYCFSRQIGLLHKKKRWFCNCQICGIIPDSGHQGELSSCHAPVAIRQQSSCTSFSRGKCWRQVLLSCKLGIMQLEIASYWKDGWGEKYQVWFSDHVGAHVTR